MVSLYLISSIVLTDFVPGIDEKIISGYLIIGIYGMTAFVNFSYIIISTFL